MKYLYTKKQPGEGRGVKRFILFSLLLHAVAFLILFGSFRGAPSLPAIMDVDIVMSRAAAPAGKTGAERRQEERHAAPAERVVAAVPPVKVATEPMKRPVTVREEGAEPPLPLKREGEKRERAASVTHVRRTVAASLRNGLSSGSGAYRARAASYSPGLFTDGGKDRSVGAGAKRQFQSMVLRKIEAAKRYPTRARKRGIEGDVVVRFTIAPNGMVEQARVTSDSRCHTWLKDAAIKTVRRGAPYLPLPPLFKGGAGETMSVKISFNLS